LTQRQLQDIVSFDRLQALDVIEHADRLLKGKTDKANMFNIRNQKVDITANPRFSSTNGKDLFTAVTIERGFEAAIVIEVVAKNGIVSFI